MCLISLCRDGCSRTCGHHRPGRRRFFGGARGRAIVGRWGHQANGTKLTSAQHNDIVFLSNLLHFEKKKSFTGCILSRKYKLCRKPKFLLWMQKVEKGKRTSLPPGVACVGIEGVVVAASLSTWGNERAGDWPPICLVGAGR